MSLSFKSYALAALIALACIFDAWTGGSLRPLWMAAAIVLTLAIAGEYLLVRNRIREVLSEGCSLSVPALIELGQTAHGELRIDNHTDSPLKLKVQLAWTGSVSGDESVQAFEVPAGRAVSRAYGFTAHELGDIDVASAYCRLLGWMGLAWWQFPLPLNAPARVVPTRLRKVEGEISTRDNGQRRRQATPAGSGDLSEIRDYRIGDPMRSIDWKSTARSGKTKVRLHEPEDSLDVLLLVDTGRSASHRIGDLTRIGHSANLCARLAQFIEGRGDNLALLTYDDEPRVMIPLGRGPRHLGMIRSTLVGLRSSSNESDPRTAVTTVSRMIRRRALVIVVTQIDEIDAAGELLTALRLLSRKHHLVVANMVDGEISELASREPDNWRDPWDQLAAREYNNAVRHTQLEMERSGVGVISAQPEQIERLLFARYNQIRSRRAVG